ncbi:hypothetical protein [Labrenzia sp. PHM005]|uniref:hypothetical protein n=1 Tax=Labrenzia sp. PHM005 TaxID=2590016 RepID=UPI0011408CFB|nr:hypothetical protein [Labrenzia sp. PHM005]QDG75596.1 hypothetical protein FJ695_06800 [Labrenzia sp. PHM005]
MTTFLQLNDGWNAEPNCPFPQVAIDENDLWLRFGPNAFRFKNYSAVPHLHLKFSNCSRFRFTPVNDEGWYRGQCRFSELAPSWGEFYEVLGDFLENLQNTNWNLLHQHQTKQRNFLFYLRDEAFECSAEDWQLFNVVPEAKQLDWRNSDDCS